MGPVIMPVTFYTQAVGVANYAYNDTFQPVVNALDNFLVFAIEDPGDALKNVDMPESAIGVFLGRSCDTCETLCHSQEPLLPLLQSGIGV